VEYKFEGFDMFERMTNSISEDALSMMLRARLQKGQEVRRERVAEPIAASHGDSGAAAAPKAARAQKVGRNDPCPCGSGKKYKNCHGAGSQSA
jgi:preprotein translocase subunit SecA